MLNTIFFLILWLSNGILNKYFPLKSLINNHYFLIKRLENFSLHTFSNILANHIGSLNFGVTYESNYCLWKRKYVRLYVKNLRKRHPWDGVIFDDKKRKVILLNPILKMIQSYIIRAVPFRCFPFSKIKLHFRHISEWMKKRNFC